MGPYAIGSATWPGLAKLAEEAGEVIQVIGKIIALGGVENYTHWDGSDVLLRLEEEMADLLAACEFVMDKNALNRWAVRKRSEAKEALFNEWHDQQSGRADG